MAKRWPCPFPKGKKTLYVAEVFKSEWAGSNSRKYGGQTQGLSKTPTVLSRKNTRNKTNRIE